MLFAVTEPSEWSPAENRELALFPEPGNYYGDPDGYMQAFESYLADQFPFREALVDLYTAFEQKTGRWYVRGVRVMGSAVPAGNDPLQPDRSDTAQTGSSEALSTGKAYFIGHDYLFLDTYSIGEARTEDYAEALELLCSVDGLTVADIILPHKNYALAEGTAGVISSDPDARNLESRLRADRAAGAVSVDVCSLFLENYSIEERADMYYKSDIHWNDLGAYSCSALAAEALAEKGIIEYASIPRTDSFFWKDLSEDHSYSGDLGRRFGLDGSPEEYIPLYLADDTDDWRYYTGAAKELTPRSELVASGIADRELDYAKISTNNLLYLRVENPDAPERRNVLILKDSYQCPTIDYFSSVFSHVTVIDPRFDNPPLSTFIEDEDIDTVLLLYHQNNYMEELSTYINASYAEAKPE